MSDWGAHRLAAAGLTDAAKGNMYGDFEDWLEDKFWPALMSTQGAHQDPEQELSSVEVEIATNARASSLRYDVSLATVIENRRLTAEGEPEKWHMEIQLPSDSDYQCGDYLAVLPLNSDESVRRVMKHFQLPWDATITVKSAGPSTIPSNTPLSIYDVLRSYVELAQPATRKTLKLCARYCSEKDEQVAIHSLADDPNLFSREITGKRTSILDLLHQHPTISLPFADYLSLLPPLRVRQYSISSTPLSSPTTCTITYGVLTTTSTSAPETLFHGVCGTYLAHLTPGDTIQVSIKPTAKSTFRLPLDPTKTPLLMFAAGTGLAPFRGFLQQRSKILAAQPALKLAPAILWLGCRSETKDRLYADEMDSYVVQGVVDIRYAFSREPDSGASKGCRYVAERLEKLPKDAEELMRLWRQGARVYVCGSREFERSVGLAARGVVVREVKTRMGRGERVIKGSEEERMKALERLKGETVEEKVESWFEEMVSQRVASDVFD